MIRAIAIDDEPVALDVIRMHATATPVVSLVAVFDNAAEALNFLQTQQVDLIFLDINMPGMNGLEFARLAPAGTQLVFTTAHTDYAVHGFDLAITDFLLKPISLPRFQKACELVQKRMPAGLSLPGRDPVIFVKDGYDLVRIRLADLVYIKAEDNYLGFVQRDKYTLTRMTMNDAMGQLPSRDFLKVHKSYIVNLAFVEKISENRITLQKAEIPVSRSVIAALKERIAG